jgi:hypothetical protein
MKRELQAVVVGACLCWLVGPAGLAQPEETEAKADAQGTLAMALLMAHEKAPQVTVSDADGVFTTNGTAEIAAPRQTVFAVLLDYGHMTSFIKSLNSSTISAHHGNQLTVVQEATGKAGPFSKDVHTILSVTSKPTSKISFVDTEKKDFYEYSGSWALGRSGKMTTVSYELVAKLKGMSPEGITEGAFKANVGTMMAEVRTEAEKRAAVKPR